MSLHVILHSIFWFFLIHYLHEATGVDVVVVEHVADFVVPAVSHRDVAVPLADIVAVAVVVVALFELLGRVSEVVLGGGEVERWVRVRPKLGSFPRPPHRLQHLVPVDISYDRHLFHLQVHFHRIDPSELVNGVFDDSLAASAAHSNFELHSLNSETHKKQK